MIGAADTGSGLAASGIWPSPVSKPEVASRPDPAGAGQIDLGPGVQVGEVGGRTLRPFQRLHVGDKLDQVAGDEARGVAQVAQRLHQHPGGSPGRSPCALASVSSGVQTPGSIRTM